MGSRSYVPHLKIEMWGTRRVVSFHLCILSVGFLSNAVDLKLAVRLVRLPEVLA